MIKIIILSTILVVLSSCSLLMTQEEISDEKREQAVKNYVNKQRCLRNPGKCQEMKGELNTEKWSELYMPNGPR